MFAPVQKDLDRTFLDLRWKPPENLDKDEISSLYYWILVREEEDIEETGKSI